MFNPPKQKYLFSRNPSLRALIENKDIVISHQKNKKYIKLLADIIDNAIYDFEDDPNIVDELKQYESTLKTNISLLPQVTTTINDSKQIGRFEVRTTSIPSNYYEIDLDIIENSNSDTIDPVESILQDLYEKSEYRYKNIEKVLYKYCQLWNIIIPIYQINSNSVKCSVEENTYYCDYNAKTINFGIGIMLRNGGLFVEVISDNDDTATWNTTKSDPPSEILNRFGLNLVSITSDYKEIILTDSLKITFIEIDKLPSIKYVGCWSCYDHFKTYPINVQPTPRHDNESKQKIKPYKTIINNVISSVIEQNKLDDFTSTEWFDEIPFNTYDNFINNNATGNNSHIDIVKNQFVHCISKLKENNIKGLRKLDIWDLLLNLNIYVIVQEKAREISYPSKEGISHANPTYLKGFVPLHNNHFIPGEEYEYDNHSQTNSSDSSQNFLDNKDMNCPNASRLANYTKGTISFPTSWEDMRDLYN
jgi:hypothetical protein